MCYFFTTKVILYLCDITHLNITFLRIADQHFFWSNVRTAARRPLRWSASESAHTLLNFWWRAMAHLQTICCLPVVSLFGGNNLQQRQKSTMTLQNTWTAIYRCNVRRDADRKSGQSRANHRPNETIGAGGRARDASQPRVSAGGDGGNCQPFLGGSGRNGRGRVRGHGERRAQECCDCLSYYLSCEAAEAVTVRRSHKIKSPTMVVSESESLQSCACWVIHHMMLS